MAVAASVAVAWPPALRESIRPTMAAETSGQRREAIDMRFPLRRRTKIYAMSSFGGLA